MKSLLLLDPNFPRPKKSPNHKNLLPVGLLKIGAYYKRQGVDVKLQRLSENTEPLRDVFDKKLRILLMMLGIPMNFMELKSYD